MSAAGTTGEFGDAAAGDAVAAWRAFGLEPAGYAHPEQVAAAFAGEIGLDSCRQLLAHARFHMRLSATLAAHFDLGAWSGRDAADALDRAIALWPREELGELALAAGAILHADHLAHLVRGAEAETLRAELGENLLRFVLHNRELAAPAVLLNDAADLGAALLADGWLCLRAWADAQPHAIGVRFLLKCPPEPVARPLAAQLRKTGREIVRRAASRREPS